MTSRQEVDASLEKLKQTALRVKLERDALFYVVERVWKWAESYGDMPVDLLEDIEGILARVNGGKHVQPL